MLVTGISDKRTTTMMMISILLILNMMIEKLVFIDGCVAIMKECDEDINTNDTSTPTQVPISGPITPITRARARQLNHQVSTLFSSCPSYLDHGDTCTLVLHRNQGEDRKGKGFAQAGFGLQNSTNSWQSPRSHTDSDWGVQVLHGILMKSIFIWIRTHGHIFSEAAAIVDLFQRCFLPTVLRHPILARWALYQVGSNKDAS